MRVTKLTSLFFIMLFSLTAIANNFEYSMIKGDTLWSLAAKYLKDPYQWTRILLKNGHPVPDINRIPIGTIVLIPTNIANDKAKQELSRSETRPNTLELLVLSEARKKHSESKQEIISRFPNKKSTRPNVTNASLQKIINSMPPDRKAYLLDYYVTRDEGLVRAYVDGQEVVIDVKLLIKEMKETRGH